MPAMPVVPTVPAPTTPAPKTGTAAPAPATIHVDLPADAKLIVDDFATKSTSANRTFVTPELTPAKEFTYTLQAEIVRDGKTLTVSEKVAVKAGEEIRVNFPAEKFATTVASK